MKFAIKYEVMVQDDEGNVLADAQANLNVSDVQTLVKTVMGTVTGVIELFEANESDARKRRNADKEAAEIFDILRGDRVSQ